MVWDDGPRTSSQHNPNAGGVFVWYHEDVARVDRLDVHERRTPILAAHHARRQTTRNDPAENTTIHAAVMLPQRHARRPPTRPSTGILRPETRSLKPPSGWSFCRYMLLFDPSKGL